MHSKGAPGNALKRWTREIHLLNSHAGYNIMSIMEARADELYFNVKQLDSLRVAG